jgi:hypothetical protein
MTEEFELLKQAIDDKIAALESEIDKARVMRNWSLETKAVYARKNVLDLKEYAEELIKFEHGNSNKETTI